MPGKLIIPIVSVKALIVSGTDAFRIPMQGSLSGEKNDRASENPREKSSERVGSRSKPNRSQVIERYGLSSVC